MANINRIIRESLSRIITEDKIDDLAGEIQSKIGSGYNMKDLQKDLIANQIKGRMVMVVGQGSRYVFGEEGHKYAAQMDNKWNVVGIQKESRNGKTVIR